MARRGRREAYEEADETGLYPIHWAAIYNRSDKLRLMLDNGSPLRIKCKNKLLANGTALHLAATNGSIEAAAVLLSRWRQQVETIPKSLTVEETSQQQQPAPQVRDWLEERDGEGQTALMRSAAPRSRRMSTIRDLLRKNLWSLSGRPAEMALFLISQGASYRETDTIYGMNLLHLAIVNNYDDIVSLLLALDKQLVALAAQMKREPPTAAKKAAETKQQDQFVTIKLEPDEQPDERRPLVDGRALRRETAQSLAMKGLAPLQLAIMYGRLAMISQLWRADFEQRHDAVSSKTRSQRKLMKKLSINNEELKALLLRVFWSSRDELVKFIRLAALKILLAVDVGLLLLLWVPSFLTPPNQGPFIVCFALTLAQALRVMYKDPGYLAQNSPAYQEELLEVANSGDSGQLAPTTDGSIHHGTTHLERALDLRKRVRLLCHRCKCIRRPRSRHCNYCDRCVQDFDHHCIYLGCCIGRLNRLDFVLMLALLSLTGLYGTIATRLDQSSSHLWRFIGFLWCFKYLLIGSISLFLNLKRACLGVTMYEELRSKRIRKTVGSRKHRDQIIEDTFWRYEPDRFLTGDLPRQAILKNLREFTQLKTANDYLLSLFCSDSSLARSLHKLASETPSPPELTSSDSGSISSNNNL